jgi:hypothetical protein
MRAVACILLVQLLVVVDADTTFDVLVDTRVRLPAQTATPTAAVVPAHDQGVRVSLDTAFNAIARRTSRVRARERTLRRHAELHGTRKLLAASNPLESAAMLVPGLTPTTDPITGQPIVEAWFFIQRGVGADQMLIQMRDGGLETEFFNDRPVACGLDISDACRYTMRIVLEATCHDITGFGAETFSDIVWCQQRVTFSPTDTTTIARSIGAAVASDIRKAVPTLGLVENTTLSARLHFVNEEELLVTPIALPDVELHFSVGRDSLLNPGLLSEPDPEFVLEGEDLCTVLTATPQIDPESGVLSVVNADLVEVAMCTKPTPSFAWELPPGTQQDPSFSCMAYAPNTRVSVLYSQRFEQCVAQNGTGSRLGGCCMPEDTECGLVDTLNTRFQCVDDATGAFMPRTCAVQHPVTFTPERECATGETCTNAGTSPLVLQDVPFDAGLFPNECLNPTGTALVDCSASTAGCLAPAGCAPRSNRLAFCMKVPTFREVRNKTRIMYEFRVDLTVVDFHQAPARRLLWDDTSMSHRTVSATKSVSVLTREYERQHPMVRHWTHALFESVGMDAERVVAVAPFVCVACLAVSAVLVLAVRTLPGG